MEKENCGHLRSSKPFVSLMHGMLQQLSVGLTVRYSVGSLMSRQMEVILIDAR